MKLCSVLDIILKIHNSHHLWNAYCVPQTLHASFTVPTGTGWGGQCYSHLRTQRLSNPSPKPQSWHWNPGCLLQELVWTNRMSRNLACSLSSQEAVSLPDSRLERHLIKGCSRQGSEPWEEWSWEDPADPGQQAQGTLWMCETEHILWVSAASGSGISRMCLRVGIWIAHLGKGPMRWQLPFNTFWAILCLLFPYEI